MFKKFKMDGKYVRIDGSNLEGGGQILRISIVLSSLLKIPIEIFNIRMGRPKPGLSSQHLHCLQLATKITNGELLMAKIGSTTIRYRPNTINAGTYECDVKTAGSLTLILQTVLPILIYANDTSILHLYGGTHVPFAPFTNFFTDILPNYLEFWKSSIEIKCNRLGFYPNGGGHITCIINKNKNIELPIKYIDRIEFGELNRIDGKIIISKYNNNKLNIKNNIEKLLNDNNINNNKININLDEYNFNNKNNTIAIQLKAATTTNCHLSSSILIDKNNNNDNNNEKILIDNLLKLINNKCCCDNYLQDQLIIYMALSNGFNRILINELTMHTKTAIWIVELLLNQKLFHIKSLESESSDNQIIECNGIGFKF